MEKKNFFEKVLPLERQTRESKFIENIAPCENFSAREFDRYIEGTMNEENTLKFEHHCLECISCAARLVKMWESWNQKEEKAENEKLFEKTMDLLDHLEHEK